MDPDDQPICHRCGHSQQDWIESSKTIKAREKLVQILKNEAYIPKQHWGLDRILVTLVHH